MGNVKNRLQFTPRLRLSVDPRYTPSHPGVGGWRAFLCWLFRHDWNVLGFSDVSTSIRALGELSGRAPARCLSRCRRCGEIVNDLPKLTAQDLLRRIMDPR